jgi:hypothetical protein
MQACVVCHSPDGLDSHHITPIAEGGPKDGPQVLLCSRCHRNIHTASMRVYSGKSTFVELFKTMEEFERAKILIQSIVNIRIQNESSGRPQNALRRMILEIPTTLHGKLHKAKIDAGHKNLQKYILQILENHVNTR